MLEEWVLRIVLGMVVCNLILGGVYLLVRGWVTYRCLCKFRTRTPAILERTDGWGAIIKWNRFGESVHAVQPRLYALKRKRQVYIFTSPQSYDFILDHWVYNGVGFVVSGLVLFAASAALLILAIP